MQLYTAATSDWRQLLVFLAGIDRTCWRSQAANSRCCSGSAGCFGCERHRACSAVGCSTRCHAVQQAVLHRGSGGYSSNSAAGLARLRHRVPGHGQHPSLGEFLFTAPLPRTGSGGAGGGCLCPAVASPGVAPGPLQVFKADERLPEMPKCAWHALLLCGLWPLGRVGSPPAAGPPAAVGGEVSPPNPHSESSTQNSYICSSTL